MGNIRTLDMQFIDDLFVMGGGLVLNFSDRTFRAFFADELNIDIDDPVYAKEGASKAKRLRFFLQNMDKATVVKTLHALWEYREAQRRRARQPERLQNAHATLLELVQKLEGGRPPRSTTAQGSVSPDPVRLRELLDALMEVSQLLPHPRGFAFEKFLQQLFNAYGLEAREPFRICGEQIDGSFQLMNSTYLLEARWRNRQCDAADLRAFNGKIEEKAAWARGLYLSNSGFTEDGLFAVARRSGWGCATIRMEIGVAAKRIVPLLVVVGKS